MIEIATDSLIIGFCKCAECGYDNHKFNWHTYFKCDQCGSDKYIKEEIFSNEEKGDRKTGNAESGNVLFTYSLSDG